MDILGMRSRFLKSFASVAVFAFVIVYLIGVTLSNAMEDTGVTLLNEQNGKIDATYTLSNDQINKVPFSVVKKTIEELIPTSDALSSKDSVIIMNNPWGTTYQINYFLKDEWNWIQYNVTQRKTELTNDQFDLFKKPGINRVLFYNEGEEIHSKVLLNKENIYAIGAKKQENWTIFWWTKQNYGFISSSLPMSLEDLNNIFNTIPVVHNQNEA